MSLKCKIVIAGVCAHLKEINGACTQKKTKTPGDSGHPAIIPHTLPSGQTFIFQKIVPADSQLLNIYIFIFLIVQTGRGNVLMSVLMLVAFCVAALSGKLNQEVLKVYTLFNTYRQIYYSLITFLQPCLTESVTLTEHHVGEGYFWEVLFF